MGVTDVRSRDSMDVTDVTSRISMGVTVGSWNKYGCDFVRLRDKYGCECWVKE